MTEPARPRFSIRDLFFRIRDLFPRSPANPPIVRPDSEDIDAERLKAQVDVVRRAFRNAEGLGELAAAGPEDTLAKDDADTVFLFRPGVAIVRDDVEGGRQYYQEFNDFFKQRTPELFEGEPRRRREYRSGMVLVDLPVRGDGGDAVLTTLKEIDDDRRRRGIEEVLAQPDHVLYVTARGALCPATEPETTSSLTPIPPLNPDESAGADVRVAVVDTGWWTGSAKHPATPWVATVTADPDDEEHLVGRTIHEYAGHGNFAAGVIKCLAPATRVEIEGVLTHGGAVLESEICAELEQALNENDLPQLISISAGTHTMGNLGLLGLEILLADKGIDDGVKTLVVAAAGNDGDCKEFYPAAYKWVVAVGSVDPDGKQSDFSNYGDWVDVYARGRDLVNAFPVGVYTCHYPENVDAAGAPLRRTFDGLAQWSGTSFATPMVTGAIAAHMSATGNRDNPRRAYDELVANAPTGPDGKPLIGPL